MDSAQSNVTLAETTVFYLRLSSFDETMPWRGMFTRHGKSGSPARTFALVLVVPEHLLWNDAVPRRQACAVALRAGRQVAGR